MAGNEFEEETHPSKWLIPGLAQEAIAGLIVALLMAGLIGVLGLWRGFSVLDLQTSDLRKDVAVLEAWKDEFGRKPRFGADDAVDMKKDIDKIDRRCEKIRDKVDAHEKEARTYIERIDHHTEKIKNNEGNIHLLLRWCRQTENGRGNP